MELTGHGRIRIYHRTKMHPDDVLSIISGDGAVDLGSSADGRRYFLFHSPSDGDAKVAVVSEDSRHLITILGKDYMLPAGVKRITRKFESEARALLQGFLFTRFKKEAIGQ